jgi:mycofactocin system transcriptional regulator
VTRPPQHLTSVEAIERAALKVFAQRGFEATRIEEIAEAAGISRRTFFRYFASKNDIPFGNFAALLADLEQWFSEQVDDRPVFDVFVEAIMRFNSIHAEGPAMHRQRMRLILQTPALRAHSALRMGEYYSVFGRYAARRMGADAEDFGPRLVAHICAGTMDAAYEEWLRDETADLGETVQAAFVLVAQLPDLEVAPRVSRRGRSRAARRG